MKHLLKIQKQNNTHSYRGIADLQHLCFLFDMIKIGLISDTHSCWDEKYRKYFSNCDEIWHAGDIGDIGITYQLEDIAPLRAVSGNIDHGEVRRKYPETLTFEIKGIRVLITHIGGYPGKYSPGMKKLLKEEHIDLFISGHSHILKVMYDKELDLLHINPGAAGKQGWHNKRTLIRFMIDDTQFSETSKSTIKDLEVIELS